MENPLLRALIDTHKATSAIGSSCVGVDLLASRACKDGMLSYYELRQYMAETTRQHPREAVPA